MYIQVCIYIYLQVYIYNTPIAYLLHRRQSSVEIVLLFYIVFFLAFAFFVSLHKQKITHFTQKFYV